MYKQGAALPFYTIGQHVIHELGHIFQQRPWTAAQRLATGSMYSTRKLRDLIADGLGPARDWVLPQYREPVALGRYGSEVLRTYALYQWGHPAGGHFPAPVRVFINGRQLGTTPIANASIRPGRYIIEAVRPDGARIKRVMRLRAAQDAKLVLAD